MTGWCQSSKIVSVIIPVYNVKDYLRTCVESVLKQSYQNLEVILVDDGSTDGSSQLCDLLAKKDNRIVVVHQDNKGSGVARNVGLTYATGDYITFVDSDDYEDIYCIEYLVNAIEQGKSQCSAIGLEFVPEDIETSNNSNRNDGNFSIRSREEFLAEMIKGKQAVSVVNKLYLSQIVKSNNIQFDQEFRFWEDLRFNIDYMQYMNTEMVCCNGVGYFARTRKGSQTRTKSALRERELLESTKAVWMIVSNSSYSENIKKSAATLYANVMISFYYRGCLFCERFEKTIYQEFIQELVSLPYELSVKKKIQLGLMRLFPKAILLLSRKEK